MRPYSIGTRLPRKTLSSLWAWSRTIGKSRNSFPKMSDEEQSTRTLLQSTLRACTIGTRITVSRTTDLLFTNVTFLYLIVNTSSFLLFWLSFLNILPGITVSSKIPISGVEWGALLISYTISFSIDRLAVHADSSIRKALCFVQEKGFRCWEERSFQGPGIDVMYSARILLSGCLAI